MPLDSQTAGNNNSHICVSADVAKTKFDGSGDGDAAASSTTSILAVGVVAGVACCFLLAGLIRRGNKKEKEEEPTVIMEAFGSMFGSSGKGIVTRVHPTHFSIDVQFHINRTI